MKLEEFLRLNAPEDLSKLSMAIATTSILVSDNIPFKAGLLSGINPSGERQRDIDVFSDDEFTEAIIGTGAASEVASEETREPVEGRAKFTLTQFWCHLALIQVPDSPAAPSKKNTTLSRPAK